MKKLLGSFFRYLGYEIRAIGKEPGLFQFLVSRKIDLVFDVGANTGQFGRELRRQGFQGDIISFEPVREVFADLQNRIHGDPKWSAHCLALGAEPGRGTVHVSRASVYSSLVKQREFAIHFDDAIEVTANEEVEIARLDNFVGVTEGRHAFLKIDTQGFEKQVLAGAERVLDKVEGVLLEVSLVPLYVDTWKLEDVVAFMRSKGFVLAQVKPVNALRISDGVSFLEIDCLFRRLLPEDE